MSTSLASALLRVRLWAALHGQCLVVRQTTGFPPHEYRVPIQQAG